MKISQWDIVVSGFRQQRGEDNGSDQLWAKLRQFQTPYRELLLYEWHDNPERVAERVQRHSPRDIIPVIRLYAYSWGGGYFFPRFAEALYTVDPRLQIDIAVLCDAVYRSRWLPWWVPANVLSLTRFPKIEIPPNVRRVRSLVQRQSYPKGHRLIPHDESLTHVEPPVVMHCNHIGADSDSQYHEMALAVAQTPVTRQVVHWQVSNNEE